MHRKWRSLDEKKRGTLITLAAVAAGYAALRYGPNLIPQELQLVNLDRPIGFRKFVAGATSGGSFDPFVGMGNNDSAANREAKLRADARIGENVCRALYGELDLSPGQVPVASFSDYYCPFCRVQTKRLADLVKSKGNEISVVWHELPLLGEGSSLAAKAALAAKRQGAYVAFHERLMKTPFVANPEYLARLSQDLEIDEEQLLADIDSTAVSQELENSAALSRALALVGTPALVVGRTVVQGQVSDSMITRIIALEREEGWAEQCNYT